MLKICRIFIAFVIASLSISSVSCSRILSDVRAPTPKAKAIDQNTVHKNGCGIVSLINAYRFASPKWRKATKKLAGRTDIEQFNFLARNYGRVKSKYSPGTNRWEDRSGISSIDLRDLANDFQNKQKLRLSDLRLTTHYISGNESHAALLVRTHRKLRDSLRSGFPPIISIKHLAGNKIEGHIVILYEIPRSLPINANSFPIKYVDPLGGDIKNGTIKIPGDSSPIHYTTGKRTIKNHSTLAMGLPQSDIAKKHPKTGNNIVLSASIAP